MCFKKDKGIRVGSSDSNYRKSLYEAHENNQEELKELLTRGFKVKKARKRVKTSEVKYPVKVTVTAPDCDWTLTVSWEHFQRRGGNCKIVKRYYE